MQEFDPRRQAVRYAPRILMAAGALTALAFAAKSFLGHPVQPARPAPSAAAIAALQHDVFTRAEAQPGFVRPERIPVAILPGETLEAAVGRAGVGRDEARQAVEMLAEAMDTVHIKAGMAFDAAVAHPRGRRGPARLIGLSLRIGPTTAITLSRTFDGALRLRELDEKVHDDTVAAQGDIEGSLYQSAEKLGATPAITAQVVKLFAHKLDFERDIQAGDDFKLVFDRQVTDSGRTVQVGGLEYAELHGVRFYRFARAGGDVDYFDEAGKTIKGFLLRTPVDGARITSLFGMRRHPVLGYTRAHQGVDFGAGTGTPILAAGDGVVLEARRWGGYGNWLRIRHAGGWDTGYGHISRYAPGVHPGLRVRQGQVVAYVGATGLATGPHLHYEVWLNGARVNPIGAQVPQGTVLAGGELAAFRSQKARIDGLLARQAGETRLAQADVPAGLR
ncbi:M23 family metallopeptidase [Phenylobacterium sp.]|uniref:M23 family metallopeptidase n=1 Tax=Phenylobacterium sp. TaxID=1871053 RepID=UPI002F3ED96C